MPIIDMRQITKRFPGVVANDKVDFQVEKQEIHCLLGENGSGKTTLMNVLFGLYHPEEGEIFVKGEKVRINNPNDAYKLGIGMVHQHFMLVNQMTVLENIILGNECGNFFLDRKASEDAVRDLITRFNFKLDLNQKIADLSVGMKQRVEIVKTLYRGADIIILDEPTAVLTPQEVADLFVILHQLRREGKTIIFITHKLNETMEMSDSVTVLRKGVKVADLKTRDVNENDLAAHMVGRQVEHIVSDSVDSYGEVVLSIKDLVLNDKTRVPVNLQVRAGEILGIAGVEGNGQQELEELIIGTMPVSSGTIEINGKDITRRPVADRKDMGIGYIPADRHKNAILSNFSIIENYLLGYQKDKEYVKNGFIDYKKLESDTDRLVREFNAKVADIGDPISSLSGGNQQKIVLSREVSHDPVLVIAAQPVRGLDIGAIEFIHKTLLRLRAENKAILLISAELSEVMNLSDRIAVLYEGQVSAEFPRGKYNQEQIGLFMAGKAEKEVGA
ncbi:ABC transporter ATP-binding protein [Youngiibacter multivorans]|uniref:Simple sugar transport system ATP-binding protein n=1 Tax=Youngiibacter multivorans TaxID=937251 RepID=A0ABS4G104_9CLOT|nr:ABC transporter ATP-binding protein [Youngiibacter multivorans]MBP1918217.1 simple sugar transport system ATP-binding protein [Youngiibacter multivorans]